MTINGTGGTERTSEGDETQRSSGGRAMNLHCAPIPGSAAPSKYLCPLLSLDVQLVSPWISYIPDMPLVNSPIC